MSERITAEGVRELFLPSLHGKTHLDLTIKPYLGKFGVWCNECKAQWFYDFLEESSFDGQFYVYGLGNGSCEDDYFFKTQPEEYRKVNG